MTTIENTNIILNGAKTKIDPNKEYTLTKDGLVETKDPLKEKWYRVCEAAKEIGVSDQTIRNAIMLGNLVATQTPDSSAPGYHWMIKESNLIEWLDDKKKIRNQKKRDEYNANVRARYAGKANSTEEITYEEPVDKDGVKMLSIYTAADRCGYKASSIRNAIHRHSLKATKHYVGGLSRWYITEADYKAWIENGSHTNHRNKKVESEPTDIQNDVVDQKKETTVRPVVDYSKITYSEKEEKLSLEKISSLIQNFMEDEIHKAYMKGFEEGRAKAREEMIAIIKEVA